MTVCVNVCHGWGCDLMTTCRRSDFNHERQPGTWSRHFQSPIVGAHCQEYQPLYREHPAGAGAEEVLD